MININAEKAFQMLRYGEYADLFLEDTTSTIIRWDAGKVEEVNTGRDAGFGLRYLMGDCNFFIHHNSLAIEDITKASKIVSKGLPEKNISARILKPETFRHPVRINPKTTALEKKINLLQQTYHAIQKVSTKICQVIFTYAEKEKENFILNSYGSSINEFQNYCTLMILVIASNGSILQTATEIIGGMGGFELLDEKTVTAKGTEAALRAVKKLSAPHAPVGDMPVVIASEAGGTMIHEAVGHSLEADLVQKGVSPVYYGKINKEVASPLITVIDDPTMPGKRGSYAFDDEGIKSQSTVLIEKGLLKTYLYDVSSSRKANKSSNGHGRRQSYRYKPIPRMSNTFIAAGDHNPDEIIGSISDGLYVKRMGGGQVNTATGDYVFEVEEGYHIQNGKIKGLVRGANLLGNGPETLKSIDRVGNDLGWGLGTCGKEGQGVPVGDAQPTIRIKKLLVGGA